MAESPTGLPDLPLLEFDDEREAMIDPSAWHPRGSVPERVVMCFFPEVVEAIRARPDAREASRFRTEAGRHYVHVIEHRGVEVAVAHPGVGAPMAAFLFEDYIALGGRRFVAVGGAGALTELALGHPVVVRAAVRDEGTSSHYVPASREIEADPEGVEHLARVLDEEGVPYEVAKTWTTDAVYRETRSRVARRRAEGCTVVEMEASAFIAVARFRGVKLAHLLYAGDSLAAETWDARAWDRQGTIRERLFELAANAVAAWS